MVLVVKMWLELRHAHPTMSECFSEACMAVYDKPIPRNYLHNYK
jgi:hypothetical protein